MPGRVLRLLPGLALVLFGGVIGLRQSLLASHEVTDFTQDYLAASALRSGRSIYSTFTRQDLVADDRSWPIHFVWPTTKNGHPPFMAVLFLPLSFLPYHVAFLCWEALSVVLYLFIFGIVVRELELRLRPDRLLIGAGLALLWFPLQEQLVEGQLSVLIAAAVYVAWLLQRRGRGGWAGALLAFATLVKLFPLLFFVYFVLRRRWRELAGGLLALGVGAAVTLLAVGWADIVAYATVVSPQVSAQYGPGAGNVSLWGLVGQVGTGNDQIRPFVALGSLTRLVTLLAYLVVLPPMLWRIWRLPPTRSGEDQAFALVCVALVLFSPISWQHALVLTVLPLTLLWRTGTVRQRRVVAALALVFGIPMMPVMLALIARHGSIPLPAPAMLPLLLPNLGLLVLAYLLLKDSPRLVDKGAPAGSNHK